MLLNIDRVLLLAIRCNLLEFVSDGCLKHLRAAHLLTLIDRWQVLLLMHAVKLILLVHTHGLHLRHHLILLLLLHLLLDLVNGQS